MMEAVMGGSWPISCEKSSGSEAEFTMLHIKQRINPKGKRITN